MSNAPRQKYFSFVKGDRWAHYDAQPSNVREWFQQFPIDLWPANCKPALPSSLDQAHTSYLAGLRDVWGPDHPAVIDAAQRVGLRNGKPVALFTPDDLDF